jgi:hypothetical protein
MRIRGYCILPTLLLVASCGNQTNYELLHDSIRNNPSSSTLNRADNCFVDFELLTEVAYLHSYKTDEGETSAALCQQIIQVPQNVKLLPKPLQIILQSCQYQGCIYQFACDDFWDNKYPNSILFACLDDKGSMRVFYRIQ